MSSNLKLKLLGDLDRVLETYKNLPLLRTNYGEAYYSTQDIYKVITLGRSAIERITGKYSPYTKQVEESLSNKSHDDTKLDMIVGIVKSLRDDVQADALQSFSELIHGELFGDFLEMARHLCDEGYKDSGAVIAGSSLEAHLRQLCDKHTISTTASTPRGTRPKKADEMNIDLAGATIYSKLDQKNVTAWLDLRNKAAHGKYSEYTAEQVVLLIAGIQDFLTRNPA